MISSARSLFCPGWKAILTRAVRRWLLLAEFRNADDIAQVAETGDECTDVVVGEPTAGLVAGTDGAVGQSCGAFGFDLAGPFGDGLRVASSVESGLVADQVGVAVGWEPERRACACSPSLGAWFTAAAGLRLRLAATWPWAGQITAATAYLQALPSG
jgi:hypothetical protein